MVPRLGIAEAFHLLPRYFHESAHMNLITSRDNPLVKELKRLHQDGSAYRKLGQVWLEGDHLCRAAMTRHVKVQHAVFAQSMWDSTPLAWREYAPKVTVLADALFAEISALESPARMGFLCEAPTSNTIDPNAPTVVLDRLQDAGNVGAILRSAAAFGFRQILAIKGTAALWSGKVLRAGMGAHFGLQLIESLQYDDLDVLKIPMIATSSHQGPYLHELQMNSQSNQQLPHPGAWLLGHEGQGVAPQLADKAQLHVRIAQPGGEESLNVAAAAAICLYASSCRGLA
jgi:TrmH family RNA methyltransferase